MHRNIKILLASSIFLHIGINLFAPLYAIFVQEVGGTLADAGIAVGIYAIFQGVLYLLFRHTPQHYFSHRHMVSVGYFIYALSYFAYIFASVPFHIYLIQALLAVGEVIITPAWSAIIATSLNKGAERNTYADFFGYRAIFQGIAAILGGFFVLRFGFDTMFVFMAAVALIASTLVLSIKEDGENTVTR